jgi:hypothetical protein
MKPRYILAIITGTLSILFLFIGIFNVTHRQIELEPFMCKPIFGCTPEEFSAKDVDIHDETARFCTFSYVNKDGNLVLILSKKQINAWVNSIENDINEIDKNYNVDISPDYRDIILNGYSETLNEDFDKVVECYTKLSVYGAFTDQPNCANYIVLKDGVSGDILYKINMHDKQENYEKNVTEFDRILSEYEFGSISEKKDPS